MVSVTPWLRGLFLSVGFVSLWRIAPCLAAGGMTCATGCTLGSASQQMEGVAGPLVLAKSRDAPQLAQRLDRARRLCGAHVRTLPSELIDDSRHNRLRPRIIATVEHRRPSAGE